MIKILIVDDEKPICDLIDLNLSAAGYFCKSVQDGMKAIELIEKETFDLILLDIMLPGVDGFDIMEYIRPLKIPVIFITAKGDVKDRVKGLRLGAEDYLVKPFDVVELLARVEVVLRRFHKRGAQLSAGDVVVDMEARMVTKAGVPVVLTNKEYGLLVLFIQNKNIALFKQSHFPLYKLPAVRYTRLPVYKPKEAGAASAPEWHRHWADPRSRTAPCG